MKKLKVGIIGTGNIGCDLLIKVQKSDLLECSLFMGRNLDSKGIKFASNLNINVSDMSINALVESPDLCDIVFDATTASAHFINAPRLKEMGKYTIDLTPSLIGKMCVPTINADECLKETNINMITCGGQATLPIVHKISREYSNIEYIEIVASIASKSAGAGTRANIDEFTQTTKMALTEFSCIENSKAIIILNPAEPPIVMNNTIYFKMKEPDLKNVQLIINKVEKEVQQYIPGYKIKLAPVYQNGYLVIMLQVEGSGDYLPKYSGNLDVITCAAVKMAELYAKKRLNL
ncbi:MAG: acetaldehyde dehydrogenase (acetylating) [Candidatus Gastranaerophilales bacterium]